LAGRDPSYDPWHYVPVLARKPGALRNGAPFKDWLLPASLERVRRKLAAADDGDRQMVDILTAVLSDGLSAVEAACTEALSHGAHSADVIINILARRRERVTPISIATPQALRLILELDADCPLPCSTAIVTRIPLSRRNPAVRSSIVRSRYSPLRRSTSLSQRANAFSIHSAGCQSSKAPLCSSLRIA
jgi:hypothetical protein